MSTFQTVCSNPFRHQVMAVRCFALRRRIFLLSRPLSSLAKQAVLDVELFISTIEMVKVFYIVSVVMIVPQVFITSLRV
jgi:hypothetical protein